jgi:hypothetical protein
VPGDGAKFGKRKTGLGFEFWVMRGNQIAQSDGSFTTSDAKEAPPVPKRSFGELPILAPAAEH